jgi:hypothetical protein
MNLIHHEFEYDSPEVSRLLDQAVERAKPQEVGGIDLSSDKALQVVNQGEAIRFHISPELLDEFKNASGFVPVVINIKPLNSLKQFLGAI